MIPRQTGSTTWILNAIAGTDVVCVMWDNYTIRNIMNSWEGSHVNLISIQSVVNGGLQGTRAKVVVDPAAFENLLWENKRLRLEVTDLRNRVDQIREAVSE